MPLFVRNISNSALLKFCSLSVTLIEGNPNQANTFRSAEMIAVEVVEVIT